MNKIEQILPSAIRALESSGIIKNNRIPSQFKGYISSFGASVISSGLLPTIAFYSNQGAAEEGRHLLLEAIHDVLAEHNKHLASGNLKEYVLIQENRGLAKREIFDACIALKLAIRTFINE